MLPDILEMLLDIPDRISGKVCSAGAIFPGGEFASQTAWPAKATRRCRDFSQVRFYSYAVDPNLMKPLLDSEARWAPQGPPSFGGFAGQRQRGLIRLAVDQACQFFFSLSNLELKDVALVEKHQIAYGEALDPILITFLFSAN
jgi:hypothetical protein